jgi:hypothetical protein
VAASAVAANRLRTVVMTTGLSIRPAPPSRQDEGWRETGSIKQPSAPTARCGRPQAVVLAYESGLVES